MVSALGPLVRNTDTIWVAAAMSDTERSVADGEVREADGFRVCLLAVDRSDWADHYDKVCNEALWFAHHGLWNPVYEPAWPPGWVDGPWAAHRRVNERFALTVATVAPPDAVILVQDYHLCLMATWLRESRPDLTLVHFSHTPFAPPDWMGLLPAPVRGELLAGLAAHHACGFHTARWAVDFVGSCRASRVVPPPTFVSPLGPDPDDLAATVAEPGFVAATAELDALAAGTQMVVRVDRIELSKNLLRGFLAFEALLDDQPDRRGQVTFGAFCYPSRTGVEAYDRYASAVAETVARINDRFARDGWTPIHYDPTDNYLRSVAALRRADVVMVNAVRDGLNLVAKEAMVVNDRDGQLVLSPEVGAWAELGEWSWRADPTDIGQTATALACALDADAADRRRRSTALKMAAVGRTPSHWLADQIRAADRHARPGRS